MLTTKEENIKFRLYLRYTAVVFERIQPFDTVRWKWKFEWRHPAVQCRTPLRDDACYHVTHTQVNLTKRKYNWQLR